MSLRWYTESEGSLAVFIGAIKFSHYWSEINFEMLHVFNRCTMKGEEDYRPLFENFVQDLLSTVNKPEWPSSELLLSILGRILVGLNVIVIIFLSVKI